MDAQTVQVEEHTDIGALVIASIKKIFMPEPKMVEKTCDECGTHFTIPQKKDYQMQHKKRWKGQEVNGHYLSPGRRAYCCYEDFHLYTQNC
jgi:flagellar hook assembly protein FlgD